MTTLGKALVLALFFAVIAAIAGLSYLLPGVDTSWHQALLGIGSFGCFGFLLGGIYAFDPESDMKIRSSAIGRISFGITASLMLSALWRWQLEGVALACFIGAVLGYFGMTWAKYADYF